MPNDTRVKTTIKQVQVRKMRRVYIRDADSDKITGKEMTEVVIGFRPKAVHTTVELTDEEQAQKDAQAAERGALESGVDKLIASGTLNALEGAAFKKRLEIE